MSTKKEINLDDVFEFGIGEVVAHCGAIAGIDRPWERAERYLIVERHLQECHGGQQRSYHARPISAPGGPYSQLSIGEKLIILVEPEICPYPQKPAEELPTSEADALSQRLGVVEAQLRRARRAAKDAEPPPAETPNPEETP